MFDTGDHSKRREARPITQLAVALLMALAEEA